jgi:hypothetical protein
MTFDWIDKDIETKLNENLRLQSIDAQRKADIYSTMLTDLKRCSCHEIHKIDRETFFENLLEFNESYFNKTYELFFNLITFLSNNISEYELDFDILKPEKKNPVQSIKLCKNFYKKNDKESLAYFKRIISIPNIIQISDNPCNHFLGRTYIINNNEFYMLINGRDYLEDSLATIHESKHVEMAVRGYNTGISLYNELPAILYELYMIDFLSSVDGNKYAVSRLRMMNLNKYLLDIKKLANTIELIKELKNPDFNLYQDIYENYDLYYDDYDFSYVNSILVNGVTEEEIGKLISFIVAIDIYLNSRINNAHKVVSLYTYGLYKMKPSIINGVLEYINSMVRPYEKPKVKK